MAVSAELYEAAPTGAAAPRRPGAVTAAGVILAATAALTLLFSAGHLSLQLQRGVTDRLLLLYVVLPAVLRLVLVVGAGLAALLVFLGRESGRVLGFAVSGVVCWIGLNAALYWLVDLAAGGRWEALEYLGLFGSAAVAALGVAVILPLSQRSSADWFHQMRSRRDLAGAAARVDQIPVSDEPASGEPVSGDLASGEPVRGELDRDQVT
ncbi:MAG: hypothetical protein ACRDT4_14320 [Micromonosporaceae bacterium]